MRDRAQQQAKERRWCAELERLAEVTFEIPAGDLDEAEEILRELGIDEFPALRRVIFMHTLLGLRESGRY